MFLGYVSYGGVEVANSERFAAYAENGLLPVGTSTEDCDVCEGLADAMGLEDNYRTPLLDDPPWLDPLNADTFDFAGVLITEITGIDDAVGVVDMTPTLADGAVAGRRRYPARQMGVTAVLAGRTTEGVQAGYAWLKSVLARTCAPGTSCGPTAPMEAFTVCPTPICPTSDESGVLVLTETYLAEDLIPHGGGSWTVVLPASGILDTEALGIDGGTPDDTEDPPIDGGDPGDTEDPPLDGGAPDTIYETPMVVGHQMLANYPATIRFDVSRPGEVAPVAVTFYLVSTDGTVLFTGPTWNVSGGAVHDILEWELPPGLPAGPWEIAIGMSVGGPITVHEMDVLTPQQITAAECIAPYRRIFPEVGTVSGPIVTKRLKMGDCAEWLEVEWIWTAGSPYRYGTDEPLIIGSSNADPDGTFAELGVTGVTFSDAVADTCLPPVVGTACADDPCYPGFTLPPALPEVVDPNVITVDGRVTRGVEIRIDPDALPTLTGIMSLVLSTETPKLGVRIRVYDNVETDWSVPDLCEPAYGWLIDYIPAEGTVTIDGTTGEVTTICEDQFLEAPTPASGMFRGPLPDPFVGCDRRVKIIVEWVTTYPRACGGVYANGADQGDMAVNVSTRTREA